MNGGPSIWAISPEERNKHDQKFDTLSPSMGYVSGEQARKFFLQSGLPASVLAAIWALADMNNDGKMDRLEFSIAMKLIKLKLQGTQLPTALPIIMKQPPVPAPNLSNLGNPSSTMTNLAYGISTVPNMPMMPVANLPLLTPMATPGLSPLTPMTGLTPMGPTATGLGPLITSTPIMPLMPTMGNATLPNGTMGMLQPVPAGALATGLPLSASTYSSPLGFSPSPAGINKTSPLLDMRSSSFASSSPMAAVPSDWAVPHASRLKYRQQFNSLDKQMSGYLTGQQVRGVMATTMLTQTQLASIWTLADVDKDGKLKAEEFILAMHLVDMAKSGQPLPLTLPTELVPSSQRGAVNGSSSSYYDALTDDLDIEPPQKPKTNMSFEDKFKVNMEQGNAELEKRRLALQEAERKEQERRAQKEREEREKREREAREAEERRRKEEERRLERQRELERQKEEERQRELERKEAAQRELERQRKEEWEKRRRGELQMKREQEKDDINRLKAKKRNLEMELETVGDKHRQISDRLRDVQNKKKLQRTELDLINQRKETRQQDINSLHKQLEEFQRKLSQMTLEQKRLTEKLKNMSLNNQPVSTLSALMVGATEKKGTCMKLRDQLEALEKETSAKLAEMDQYNKDIQELRESQRKQQAALEKLQSVKEDKRREVIRKKEQEEERRRREEERKQQEEERRRREEEEAQRRIQMEKERQWQEKLRRDEEERQRRLQEEREAKQREEEERERQALIQAAKEQVERELKAKEEAERKKREEEDRRRREEEERKRQAERRRQEDERRKLEEERRQLEEERRKLEEERRKEEKRRKEEEERRRLEEERKQLEEERRKLEEERRKQEKRRKEEEELRRGREEEERRKHKASEAALRDAEERRNREEEDRKKREEEDRRKREEERRRQHQEEERRKREEERKRADEEKKRKEDEERRKAEEERKRKEEPPRQQLQSGVGKLEIQAKLATLLKGLEERKGKQPRVTQHRKSATLTSFKALYPFTARNNEELSFNADDVIEVDEATEREEGWLCGSRQGKMGWFPESYVERVAPSDTASSSTPVAAAAPKVPPQSQLSLAFEAAKAAGTKSAFTPTHSPNPAPSETQGQQVLGNVLAQALCSWTAKTDNHLNFNKDDVIQVLEQQENWWLGELNGEQGWFPKTYVTLLGEGSSDIKSPPPDSSESSDSLQLEEYVALYTYESPEPGDLIFTEGDVILVSKREGEWWNGSIGNRTGLFPGNYVKPKETDTSSASGKKKPEIAKVIRAHTSTSPEQLNLENGQLILILSKNASGWWLGELQARGKKRQKGWFPVSHVTVLGSNSGKSTPAPQSVCQVIAMYDYTGANKDEMSFSKGQLINVLDKNNPDWWKGELNGETGLFPTNYVKIKTTDSDPSQQWCTDLNSLDSLSPQEKKRQGYIHELIQSEERYVEDLQIVLEVFYKPMFESGRLNEGEMAMIFVNWKDLLACNTKFLKALHSRKKTGGENMPVQMIGDILATELSHMQPYICFCSCQINGASLLQTRIDNEPDFKNFLKKIATDYRCKGMPLSSFLLKPMQRITRYPLHIKNILECTAEGHADRGPLKEALERAEELCQQVNEGVREKESSDRLEWIQNHIQCDGAVEHMIFNSLTNCMGPRKLLHSGKIYKAKSNRELWAFLFNDFLLLTYAAKQFISSGPDKLFSIKSNVQLKMYKPPLLLNEVLVKLPDPSSDEPLFQISHIDRVYALRTDNINERTAWIHKIKAASEEFIETEKKKRDKAYQARSVKGSGIGRLLVTILEATELKAAKPNGKSNPYCEVTMGAQLYTSRTLNDTLNPKWNFNCQFHIKDFYQDVLCITIFEKDQFSPDEFLGRTEVPVATIKKELENKGPTTRRLLLHEVPTGEVWVRLDLQLFDK